MQTIIHLDLVHQEVMIESQNTIRIICWARNIWDVASHTVKKIQVHLQNNDYEFITTTRFVLRDFAWLKKISQNSSIQVERTAENYLASVNPLIIFTYSLEII